MTKFIFWLSLGMLFYTYVGYPLALTMLARVMRLLRPLRGLAMTGVAFRGLAMTEGKVLPKVSIIMPVYNEGAVIKKKINNCLHLDYPKDKLELLIGSDGSTDETNDILIRCPDERLKYIMVGKRMGKPGTINRLVKNSTGEILFFTDARQVVERGALKKLVRNFQDPEVGSASGELLYERKESITARGIGVYWEYEKYLREKESEIYSMIGATGAIYAVRKKLFEPLPENIILDDVWTPLVAVNKGYRAVLDREAKAYDIFADIPRVEHRRKVRTLSGNYQVFFRMPHVLNPFRSKIAIQIISHKLLRLVAPFFMLALFISNIALLGAPLYNVLFTAQISFYSIALFEAVFRRRIKRVFGIPYLFCLLNFSALVGLWNFLFNKIDIKWEKA